MDYFCKDCAGRAKWEWDETKVIQHACQRCYQVFRVNDYSYRTKKQNVLPAPKPADLVKPVVNPHSEVNLPKVEGHRPLIPVAPPAPGAIEENDTDKALKALNPEGRGIKLQTSKK